MFQYDMLQHSTVEGRHTKKGLQLQINPVQMHNHTRVNISGVEWIGTLVLDQDLQILNLGFYPIAG